MSKRGSYLGGHSVVRHAKPWQYEVALSNAATEEKRKAILQQEVHDKLSALHKDKDQHRLAEFDRQVSAGIARRLRLRETRKSPSVELLKNQNL